MANYLILFYPRDLYLEAETSDRRPTPLSEIKVVDIFSIDGTLINASAALSRFRDFHRDSYPAGDFKLARFE